MASSPQSCHPVSNQCALDAAILLQHSSILGTKAARLPRLQVASHGRPLPCMPLSASVLAQLGQFPGQAVKVGKAVASCTPIILRSALSLTLAFGSTSYLLRISDGTTSQMPTSRKLPCAATSSACLFPISPAPMTANLTGSIFVAPTGCNNPLWAPR